MILGNAIYSRLHDDSAVFAIVGTNIFPENSPVDVYPMIVYQIEGQTEQSLDARTMKEFIVVVTMTAGGFRVGRFDAYATVHNLADAVKTALDNQGGTWGGVAVKGFFFQSSAEDRYSDSANAESSYYEVEHTYRVWATA
jgi:hypothetical protein